MTRPAQPCLHCQHWPATRLAIPYSGQRYFCSARCAAAWAVGLLDRAAAERGTAPVGTVNGREENRCLPVT